MYYICLCNEYVYKQHTFNNISLDEVDKISSDYITSHNKKFDFYYTVYLFGLQLDNNITANIETNYHINTDYVDLSRFLLFVIDICQSRGRNFSNINHMIINTISCRCSMSYNQYINNPMSMLERRINFLIARNPKLINSLDRTKNHPLIRKYSHI